VAALASALLTFLSSTAAAVPSHRDDVSFSFYRLRKRT